jgi:hypothetical protein
VKYIVAFAAFWYDFIVGDSWLLAACGALVLGLAWLLVEMDADYIAEVVLPVVVIGGIAISLPLRR